MDTNLTVDDILIALYDCGKWNKRQDIFIPNLSWGILNHEADLAIITKSGYLTEIEIKRSWEDFKIDFKKAHEHKDPLVYNFYFCLPESIKDRAIEYLKQKFPNIIEVGVLFYSEDGHISQTSNTYARTNGRKLFIEEQLKIARLGCMRIWNLKKKIKSYGKERSKNPNP